MTLLRTGSRASTSDISFRDQGVVCRFERTSSAKAPMGSRGSADRTPHNPYCEHIMSLPDSLLPVVISATFDSVLRPSVGSRTQKMCATPQNQSHNERGYGGEKREKEGERGGMGRRRWKGPVPVFALQVLKMHAWIYVAAIPSQA